MMKTIQTETIIASPQDKIWKLLTDFNGYGDWNPFIIKISGDLKVGSTLHVTMSIEGRDPAALQPKVLSVVEKEKFCWRGRLGIPGMFQGTHYFTLEEIETGKTRFIHGEIFKGFMVGIILRRIGKQTLDGFEKMNQALKEKAEN